MYKTFHANRSPDSQVHNILLCYGRKTEPPWLAYSRKQGDVVTPINICRQRQCRISRVRRKEDEQKLSSRSIRVERHRVNITWRRTRHWGSCVSGGSGSERALASPEIS